jgi:tetratricopeptide (TPR) repeat protein
LGGAVITVVFLALKSDKGSKMRKFAWGGLVLVLLVVGAFFAVKNTEFAKKSPVLSRFSSLSLSEIKTQGRYFVWPIAVKGFLDRPVFGWGQESFNFVFNKYYDPRMYNQEPWFDRTHDIFLDWLIDGGLLGLLSYLSIFAALLYYLAKSSEDFLRKEDKAVILGLVAAYIFHNIFVFDQIGSYILFFLLLAYISSRVPRVELGLAKKLASPFGKVSDNLGYRPVLEAGISIAMVVALYLVVWAPWRQNLSLLEVLKINASGQPGTAGQYLKPLSSFNMGYSEAIEHISQTAISVSANQQAPAELKTELFNGVDAAFKRFISKVPDDARYRLFYGIFLTNFNKVPEGTLQFEKAVELSPRKQSILFQLANNYLLQGKINEAVDTAKKAYELETSYDDAKVFYGLLLMVKGDPQGSQILSSVPEEKLVFDDRYIGVLQQLGQYDKVIAVAKRRTELNSVNPQYKLNLAAAYLMAGRRQDAVNVLQQMIKDDPTFKERGEYFINEIKAGRNP